ncbi:fibroblast growth factor 2 isoform X3 [Pelodiscus sinensis]|uniref:fibroblast growth factor 2 isoform X3 n=1 Tax=Pelodiscus sinensis TaxID=13735 RepID=UPI000D71F956|nr:fibroblast growth factor 2 isoform X4 [Pelodiscus sinensis]|eukprot:XP_025041698.1 fibroblast growth factor 2 isoform X4 [Pelodiscus sinensis]
MNMENEKPSHSTRVGSHSEEYQSNMWKHAVWSPILCQIATSGRRKRSGVNQRRMRKSFSCNEGRRQIIGIGMACVLVTQETLAFLETNLQLKNVSFLSAWNQTTTTLTGHGSILIGMWH